MDILKMIKDILKMIKDNIFIIILVFVLFYFFKNRENMVPERKEGRAEERKEFIPSKKCIGAKKGYVFKKDTNGLGYYNDI